jgi:hypothetical protein
MDTNTLLIIVVVIFLFGGFGWYGRGRWYSTIDFLKPHLSGGFTGSGTVTIFWFGDFRTGRRVYGRASACDRSGVYGGGVG